MNDARHPPKPLRLRGDLEIVSHVRGGRRKRWLASPISGRVVSVSENDFRALTGAASLGNAGAAAPENLWREASAQGLLAGVRPAPTQALTRWWTNPLYIRCRGVPADRVARFLAAHTDWLFSRWAVGLWCMVFAVTSLAILAHIPLVWTSLRATPAFQAQHWIAALLALASTKIIHELAHAAVCRRMGAQCREIGVLLLCGTPCLYCDVTDSWRVPSRRRRAAIMLAGIYVEWVLASLATWIWILAGPSPHRLLAFHVMIVCGVSTVIFNINPLMRYDGYFVLSDMLDVANLRQRAIEAWRRVVVRRIAGPDYHSSPSPHSAMAQLGLALYHVASFLYRYVIIAALCGWFAMIAEIAGLAPLGRLLWAVAAVLAVMSAVRGWTAIVRGWGEWRPVPLWRRWILGGVLAALAAATLLVPIEQRVRAEGRAAWRDASTLFVPLRATVDQVYADYGSAVRTGDPLARLSSSELKRELERDRSQLRQAELSYDNLLKAGLRKPQVQAEIDGYRAAIDAARTRLRMTEQLVDSLTLVATRNGILVRDAPGPGDDRDEHALRLLSLAHRRGATLEKGGVWCRISCPQEKQVLLEVDARQRRSIEVGDRVKIQIDQGGGSIAHCPVTAISVAEHNRSVDTTTHHSDRFLITCRLPESIAESTVVGASAVGVWHAAPRRLCDLIVEHATGTWR